MKNIIFALLLVSSLSVSAQSGGKTGVGAMLGLPTGVTAKHWLNAHEAVDAAAGWSLNSGADFSIHGDYLWHKPRALFVGDDNTAIDAYYGVGGRMTFADDIELGPRMPLGVRRMFQEPEMEGFAEIAPVANLVPRFELDLSAMIGARKYF